jgi:hypothetical protein
MMNDPRFSFSRRNLPQLGADLNPMDGTPHRSDVTVDGMND